MRNRVIVRLSRDVVKSPSPVLAASPRGNSIKARQSDSVAASLSSCLIKHCTEGEVAPFVLDSVRYIAAWTKVIRMEDSKDQRRYFLRSAGSPFFLLPYFFLFFFFSRNFLSDAKTMVPRVSQRGWQSMWEIRPRSSHHEAPVAHGKEEILLVVSLSGGTQKYPVIS